MGETTRTRRAGTALPTGALVIGGTLFVIGLVLGLAAALRFGTALQRSAASCALATGHDMAWSAVAVDIAGIVVATLAIVAELRRHAPDLRPVTVVLASVVAGASVFAAAFNLFVVHEISTCAALFG
jgi:hypothetical protein